MALRPLSPREIAETQTLFTSFMGRSDDDRKTVGELLEIYRERSVLLRPEEDRDDNLRAGRFMEDMASERWRGKVVVQIGVFDGAVLVIDGTHRGIAYLGCIEQGLVPERLPELYVDL